MAVRIVTLAKNKKNPKLKDIISKVVLLSMEKPTITGIRGRTHGEMVDAIPAKKDSM
jgi:hypothetical protein